VLTAGVTEEEAALVVVVAAGWYWLGAVYAGTAAATAARQASRKVVDFAMAKVASLGVHVTVDVQRAYGLVYTVELLLVI
jgi:hypothetical protein